MLKRIFFLCVCMCLLLASCAAAEEALLYVNGEPITQNELSQKIRNIEVFNNQTMDELTEEEKQLRVQKMQREALNALISEKALIQEANKRGFTTDSEAVRADADQRYQSMIASVESYVLSAYSSMQGEELDAQVDSLLKTSGSSRDEYMRIAEQSAMLAALDKALLSEMARPEQEEILAYYEALYQEQKKLFQNQNEFEAAMLQGKIVVHRPVDLKIIQKAEFLFADGAYALISQTAGFNPEMAEEMRADQYRQIEGQVRAARDAVVNGKKTFAQIMEECREGSSSTVNYFHESSTRFHEDYYSRAKAFREVGEVSTEYQMSNGYALLYYAGDLPAVDRVPLEEVRESIEETLLEAQRIEKLTEARTEIIISSVITYPEGT